MLDTHGMERWEVLKALYDKASPLGMGAFSYIPGPMTKETSQKIIDGGQTYFDYLGGRLMKIDLGERSWPNNVEGWLYDRDNGQGAAQRALDDYYTSPERGG